MHARFVDRHFHHMPVPGNLREQSKPYSSGEVAQRRRGGVFAADAFRFVAVDSEALNAGYLAHAFERLAVGFNEILSVGYLRVQCRRWVGKIRKFHIAPLFFAEAIDHSALCQRNNSKSGCCGERSIEVQKVISAIGSVRGNESFSTPVLALSSRKIAKVSRSP